MKIQDILSNKESLQEVLNQLSEAIKDFLVADDPSIKWEMPVTDTVATQVKYKECTLREWCKKMFEEKAMSLKHLAWILGITPEEVNDAINPAYADNKAKFHPGYNVYNQAHTEKLLREKDAEIEEKNKRIDDLTDVISKKAKPYEKYPNSIYKNGRVVSSCQCNDKKRIAELESEITRLKEKCDAQTNLITTLYARINNLENFNTGSPWFFPNFTWSDNTLFTKEQISEAAKKFSNAPPPEIVEWCVVKAETK